MRETRPYTYLGTVRGMCRGCRALVPARVFEEGGSVYQESLCPACGSSRAMIAEDLAWYAGMARTTVKPKEPPVPGSPVASGCPGDCGPCAFHAGACTLPVFSVTNACDMRCPICFTYNRRDREYFMAAEELEGVLDLVAARSGGVDLVDITGGEPTLHPGLLDLVARCRRRPGIGRVCVNTNGLRLAEDEALCQGLAGLGAYVILSFHTFRPEVSVAVHGQDVVERKLKALENLERARVGTTLLFVMIGGVNEGEAGEVVKLALSRDNVRNVVVQTMTYTGQGGGTFGPRSRVPLDRAARILEETTGGRVARAHFFPHPAAHPLCYSVAYYLRHGRGLRSFTDFMAVEELRGMLEGGYLMRMDESAAGGFRRAVDRLWASGGQEAALKEMKALLGRLYPAGGRLSPSDRQRAGEESVMTVYLHAHMDEETLDLSRLACCPDQVPGTGGRMIPACAYNLFYRMKDPRFWPGEEAGDG